MSDRSGRARGALEREVLACLAAATAPMTAGEVQTQLGASLAYTTVMTTLSRLHAKHAISRTQVGRAYAYTLVGDADAAAVSVTAFQMNKLLTTGSDRAGVLSRFVAELTNQDEELLQQLLAEDVPRRRKQC